MVKFVKKIILVTVSVLVMSSHISLCDAMPVVVFAHGLGENAQLCRGVLVSEIFPNMPLYGNTGPEALVKRFDISKICFGQQDDIKQVIAACEEALKEHDTPEIIAFGVSKGAATWINTLGYLHKNEALEPHYKKILESIKAVVVVAPFADLYEAEILAGLSGPLKPLAQRFVLPDPFGLGKKVVGVAVKLLLPVLVVMPPTESFHTNAPSLTACA